MKFFIVTIVSFFMFMSVGTVAIADPGHQKCGKRDDIVKHLTGKYKEQIVSSGVDSSGNIVEILTNPETSTWTLLITKPTGETCVIADGDNWRTKSPEHPDILV